MAAQLVVKWQTGNLPNNGWVVRRDIPVTIADQFAHQLFGLQENAEGLAILAKLPITNFEAASDETYRPVRVFLDVFAKTVRPVE